MRANERKELAAVVAFNNAAPVGTGCIVWTGARAGDGKRTKTRSHAHMMCGQGVVFVEGIPSCISLSHVDLVIDGIRTIPALSLWQPWATAIAAGLKKYETRGWKTDYRGPLAIHASKGTDGIIGIDEASSLVIRQIYQLFSPGANPLSVQEVRIFLKSRLPLGKVLCVADLVDCHRTQDIRGLLPATEQAFGNYQDGRWAWQLENVRVLVDPQVASGRQSIWPWEVAETSLRYREAADANA